MKLLLDTHALIWWLLGDAALPRKVAAALGDPGNDLYVSSASAWEVATKYRLGKLPQAESLLEDFSALLGRAQMAPLAVTIEHALAAGGLDTTHADPFDRMLAAQARIEDMRLVTGDRALRKLVRNTLW